MAGRVNRPLLSVIVPIYNSGAYLDETIRSVISQDIGFDKTIELVLIDDGSTDDSASICKRYKKKYPNNIHYIKQVNQGVSAARNMGLKHANGQYVHLFDSDDLISKNFYRKMIQFLNKNLDVDVVASKIYFFDNIIDSHPLNFKFINTRVINLDLEPNNPLIHMATCVFRRDAIKNIRFDVRLKISEDIKFLSHVLKEKKKYGVVKESKYFYRKRRDDSSAIDGKLRSRDYYLTTPGLVYRYIIKSWFTGGSVHPYVQHMMLYDLLYRFEQSSQTVLSDVEVRGYKRELRKIIDMLDDEIILSRNDYDVHIKKFLFEWKYGEEVNTPLHVVDRLVGMQRPSVSLDFLYINGNKLEIEGYSEGLISNDSLGVFIGTDVYEVASVSRLQRQRTFLGDVIYDGGGFKAEVSLGAEGDSLEIKANGQSIGVHFGRFVGINNISGSFTKKGKYLVYKKKRSLKIKKYRAHKYFFLELRYQFRILANFNTTHAVEQYMKLLQRNLTQLPFRGKVFEILKPWFFVVEAIATIPEALYLRTSYYILNLFKRNKIWIISDRGLAAGDNGEALFRYAAGRNEGVKIFFAVSKKSQDYHRLRSIGNILDYGSLRYKLLFLLSDNIISSHADVEVTNPFYRQLGRFVDLLNFNFVFLQHGVIRHDHSDWLNRYEKNIQLFVVSAYSEYNSIFNYPYYYEKNNVLLSGLPRFDYLNNDPKNKLIIAPTYRAGILRTKTDKYGGRPYDPSFKYSGYFKFYNELISNTQLTDALKESGMTAELYIHPNFSSQISDFTPTEPFSIPRYPYNYTEALSHGSLLVSDYSSIVADFAYMKKPIIYSKFDEGDFYSTHSYGESGFFNDESDGFGVVTYTYSALIKEIIGAIKAGCEMKVLYRDRVNKFFYKIDDNNSRRVYDAIIELDNRRSV